MKPQHKSTPELIKCLEAYDGFTDEDKAFIVKAVNCHEDLLDAAKQAMEALKHWGNKAETYEKANDPIRLNAHGKLNDAIAKTASGCQEYWRTTFDEMKRALWACRVFLIDDELFAKTRELRKTVESAISKAEAI